MEFIKNIVLALHIIGVASLLGGVLVQIPAIRAGRARIIRKRAALATWVIPDQGRLSS